MNILENQEIKFDYAGYFIANGVWKHPERTEKTYELIFVTRGTVHLFDELSGNLSAAPGELIILEPEVRHIGTEEAENVRFYWVHFYVNGSLPFKKRYFERFEQGQLFRELLHLNNLPTVPSYAVNAVLVHILSELCRISEEAVPFDRRAEEIYEWLRINASAELKADAAAKFFGFSRDHLSRILKNSYGCGAKSLINSFLTEKAKNLLCNTELYVKEIAAQLRFSSDKAFIGFFKYHEGAYPEEFRSRFAKTHMNNR